MHFARLRECLTIIAAGLAVRLLLVAIVDPFSHPFSGDAMAYAAAEHPSAYSWLFFMDWRVIIAFQCALTIGTAVGAYLILRNFWTGVAIAACPFFAIYDLMLLSESVYVNLIFWSFMLYRRTPWSGTLLGLAILVRSTFFFLPAAVFAVRGSKRSMIFCGMAYLVALPALAFVGQEHGGLNLWVGTWERTPAWYGQGHGLNRPAFPARAHVTPQEAAALARMDDEQLSYAAIERIKRNPPLVLLNWIIRYPRLWIGTRSDQIRWRIARHSPAWIALKGLLFALNLTLLVLGFAGLWRLRGPFAIPVLYTAAIYIPFHNAETRYSLAALPFLIFFAVKFISSVDAGRWLRRTFRPVADQISRFRARALSRCQRSRDGTAELAGPVRQMVTSRRSEGVDGLDTPAF